MEALRVYPQFWVLSSLFVVYLSLFFFAALMFLFSYSSLSFFRGLVLCSIRCYPNNILHIPAQSLIQQSFQIICPPVLCAILLISLAIGYSFLHPIEIRIHVSSQSRTWTRIFSKTRVLMKRNPFLQTLILRFIFHQLGVDIINIILSVLFGLQLSILCSVSVSWLRVVFPILCASCLAFASILLLALSALHGLHVITKWWII